jgi:hypothetical protein
MVIMMKDVLSVLILSAGPQAENAASALVVWVWVGVGVGVGSCFLDDWCVESVPDA